MTCFSRSALHAPMVLGLFVIVSNALGQTSPASPKPATPPNHVATSQPATQPTTAPAADLPKAETLIDAALEAMGGKKNFDDLESMSMVGAANMMGQKVEISLKVAKGDRFLMAFESPMGNTSLGSDGKTGWVLTPMGAQVVEGEELDQLRKQAQQINLYRLMFNIKDEFKDHQTLEKTTFADKECYKVKASPKEGEGAISVNFFFGVEDKLPAGLFASQNDGTMDQTIKFSEWKPVDKFKLFTQVTMTQSMGEQQINYSKIEFNKVEASAFEVPAEVKKAVEPAAPAGSQPASAPAPAAKP